MPIKLAAEERKTLTYLRSRVRRTMAEDRLVPWRQPPFDHLFGTLTNIAARFQSFVNLSGRHFPYMADRIRSLGRALGIIHVDVDTISTEEGSLQRR